MKTAIFATALLSLASCISASLPICSSEGNSLKLPNGSYPYNVYTWSNVYTTVECQQLCLTQDGCYSYALHPSNEHSSLEQCHGYSNIVPPIGWEPKAGSGYIFNDLCCPV